MKIIGLDVCKNSVVAWELEEIPKNFKAFFREHKRKNDKESPDPLKFYANEEGIKALLALKPDAIVLEPTGVHYSWIWARICKSEGITVKWVGHQEATHYRQQHKLPDKNDQADALALAAYTLTHWHNPDAFLEFEAGKIAELRHLWLQLQSVNRIKSPVINRIRQQLAREFPEVAMNDTKPSATDGKEPLWCWLAGIKRNLKTRQDYYDKVYEKSIAKKYGVEISNFTRRLANNLCELRDWEIEIEISILEILEMPEFKPYRQVMNNFGIPGRCQGLLLSQIYPISKFESIGRFKRRLGMGANELSSGDTEKMNAGNGSKLCRSQLYLWIYNAIAVERCRPKNHIGEKLGEFYDKRKSQFQDNPELWKEKIVEREQQKALYEFKQKLEASILPIVGKDATPQIKALLELTLASMQANLIKTSGEISTKVKETEAKKGFGNLIINQTAAYGCRLLFRELKKAVGK